SEQAGIVCRAGMLFVFRYRKSRVLDIGLDFQRIDVCQARFPKALTDEEFRSRHMIGSHRCIGCSSGDMHEIAFFVADIFPLLIASAYPPYIANVVTEK